MILESRWQHGSGQQTWDYNLHSGTYLWRTSKCCKTIIRMGTWTAPGNRTWDIRFMGTGGCGDSGCDHVAVGEERMKWVVVDIIHVIKENQSVIILLMEKCIRHVCAEHYTIDVIVAEENVVEYIQATFQKRTFQIAR